MLKRTIAISLLILLTVGICLPFVVSNAHGVRQNSQVGQRRHHRSRAWWRRYRARLRKKRAAALELARRKALLTLPGNINLGNFIAVAPPVTIAPSVPAVNVTNVDLSFNTAAIAPAVAVAPVAPVIASPKFNAAPFAPTINAARSSRAADSFNVAPTLNVAPPVNVALPTPQLNIARVAPTVKAGPATRTASAFNATTFAPAPNTPSLGPIVTTTPVMPVVKAAPVAPLVNTAHVAPSVNISSLSAPVNTAPVLQNVAPPPVRVTTPTVPVRSTRTTMATSTVGSTSTLVNAPIVAPAKAAVEPRPVTDTRLRPKNPVSPLPGELSIAVVALSRPNPAFLTAREEQKLLAGVAFGDLRRIVIDRMVTAGGWVTNDYVREINGGKVFVVTAKTPKEGQTPEKVWTFYFTESGGRIYSLTTDSPAEHTERMSREAERFIGTLRSTPVEK